MCSNDLPGALGRSQTMPKVNLPTPDGRHLGLPGVLAPGKKRSVASRARHVLLGPGGGVLIGAATVAVAAWQEIEHRRIDFADLRNVPVRVSRLSELKHDAESLALIEAGLKQEWGRFGLLGFESIHEMLTQTGDTVFIALLQEGGKFLPKASLQTTLVHVEGDPALLAEAYPSFDELTSARTMHRAARRGGDTALLLQITVFDQENRGLGIGSLLRDAGLNLLDAGVKYALTMTPVDVVPGKPALDLAEPATYTPAMRFHAKGGAQPTIVLPAYKRPDADGPTSHGSDIIVMRYARDEHGSWPVAAPAMRIHRTGPLQSRWNGTRRRIGRLQRSLRGFRRRNNRNAVIEDGLTQE